MNPELPISLYTADQVRELDRLAIEEHGIPGSTLMARAAEAVFKVLGTRWAGAKNIAIVCGAGNNAGDGFVLARIAAPLGWNVTAFLVANPEAYTGDAREAFQNLNGLQVVIKEFSQDDLSTFDLIVDAVFGSGLNRPVEGKFKDAVEAIVRSGKPVLAIDMPSGLNADTGNIMDAAVKAHATVTFVGLKRGLFTSHGPELAGEIFFDALGVPSEIYVKVPATTIRITDDEVKDKLPPRPKNSHKGSFGHVLIVGGDSGMVGAACLASEAALRTGAGLVSLATRKHHALELIARRPEIMVHGVEKPKELDKLIERATVIAVGPGLGQEKWGESLFKKVLDCDKPLVIDADALNLLGKSKMHRDNWILTPHSGEAARLLGIKNADIQKDRFAAVQNLHKTYGGIIVLKGCGTLVFDGNGPIALCTAGNPGMASGGMGDALMGIITALAAQRLTLFDAAKIGTYLHAKAGDAAAQNGERGTLASDLLDCLRKIVNA